MLVNSSIIHFIANLQCKTNEMRHYLKLHSDQSIFVCFVYTKTRRWRSEKGKWCLCYRKTICQIKMILMCIVILRKKLLHFIDVWHNIVLRNIYSHEKDTFCFAIAIMWNYSNLVKYVTQSSMNDSIFCFIRINSQKIRNKKNLCLRISFYFFGKQDVHNYIFCSV